MNNIKFEGFNSLKKSKRASSAIIGLIMSIVVPLVLAFGKNILTSLGIDIDIQQFAPQIIDVIGVVVVALVFGYSIQDASREYAQNKYQPKDLGVATSEVIDVVSDLVEDGSIDELDKSDKA